MVKVTDSPARWSLGKGNLAHHAFPLSCSQGLLPGTFCSHLFPMSQVVRSAEFTKPCWGRSPAQGKVARREESSRPAIHRGEPFCNYFSGSSPPWELDSAEIITSILQMRKVKFQVTQLVSGRARCEPRTEFLKITPGGSAAGGPRTTPEKNIELLALSCPDCCPRALSDTELALKELTVRG